jgi:hypothetical protein
LNRIHECIQREKDGFKRTAPCPHSSHGSRPVSANFERSNIISPENNQSALPQRPMSAMPTTSMQSFSMDQNIFTPSMAFQQTRPSTAGASTNRSSTVKLPRYVETDRQVARFFGYFIVSRPWDREGPLGESLVEPQMVRQVTIHYFIFDDTVEIKEPKNTNAGMAQGVFLRRGRYLRDDQKPMELPDFAPGNKVPLLGNVFCITDADSFTRDYFKYVYL